MTMHGIILAGGISSRMGFPKALTPIGDSFFLHQVYTRLTSAGVTPVHIVINTGLRAALSAQMGKFTDGRLVPNPEPGKGQIYSLQLGLASAREAGAPGALVALVDLPLVEGATIARLAEAAAAAPDKIVLPQHGGRRGHPYVIPAAHFDAFLGAAEGQTARDIMEALAAQVTTLDVDDPHILTDIDSPDDLSRATAHDADLD